MVCGALEGAPSFGSGYVLFSSKILKFYVILTYGLPSEAGLCYDKHIYGSRNTKEL